MASRKKITKKELAKNKELEQQGITGIVFPEQGESKKSFNLRFAKDKKIRESAYARLAKPQK